MKTCITQPTGNASGNMNFLDNFRKNGSIRIELRSCVMKACVTLRNEIASGNMNFHANFRKNGSNLDKLSACMMKTCATQLIEKPLKCEIPLTNSIA